MRQKVEIIIIIERVSTSGCQQSDFRKYDATISSKFVPPLPLILTNQENSLKIDGNRHTENFITISSVHSTVSFSSNFCRKEIM